MDAEPVDELLTPGCPNCAIKHLSAAIAEITDCMAKPNDGQPTWMEVQLARAYINIVEAKEGYCSHLEYALGIMVSVEESCIRDGMMLSAQEVRDVRLRLSHGRYDDGFVKAMRDLNGMCHHGMAAAHFHEALRELPELNETFRPPFFGGRNQEFVNELHQAVLRIREEYFSFKGKPEEKGDESHGMCDEEGRQGCRQGR